MTFTVTLSEIALLLIALGFVILVIYLIPTIFQLRQTIRAMEELTLKSKDTVESVNEVIKKTGGQAGEVGEAMKKFLVKEGITRAVDIIDPIVTRLKRPFITMVSILIGLTLGLRFLTRKKK
ncbi:MAG: hypothetical protein ACE5GF_04900 [Thermodesulfobacteriota bacterium]